ncbi:hypothetical protein QKT49_gp222 [Acanthamoeba castellanii medusavirus]|uniref:Uncharacterized protein n=1 Tax=Acanthamoeba castellanii medusavirus J1 TaxID=3114988 RepID=A0A3T1CXJ4_9VIRU|nr:hypothetical protein QKT49_gp222 [Acanthamoeba castellanii medusavirus]BBI30541.1 hypothetical protein [Acanthamoeba castellanii medusavirus J1]
MAYRYCCKYYPRSSSPAGYDTTRALWNCKDLNDDDLETVYGGEHCRDTPADLNGCSWTFVSSATKAQVREATEKLGLVIDERERNPYPSIDPNDAPRYRPNTTFKLCRGSECKIDLTEEQADRLMRSRGACNERQQWQNVERCTVSVDAIPREMLDVFCPEKDRGPGYGRCGAFSVRRHTHE